MKKIILIIIAFLITFPISTVFAQQNLWDEANAAYTAKDYSKAEILYDSLFQYGESPELYYNYANALYKNGHIAQSILNYERALRINPSYEDAKVNLEFLGTQITDKIVPIEVFFAKQWLISLGNMFSSNTWAYLSITFFVIMLITLLIYLFSRKRMMRKIAFFTTLVMLTLFIVSISYSFTSKQKYEDREYAIIMSGSTSVKSSPDESGTELFVLHEGTKVKILSILGEWSEVKIADGNIGWMPSTDVEKI